MRYEYVFTPQAQVALRKLARKNPQVAQAIIYKIQWLAEHADEVAHQPIKGSPFFSLHYASFWIPYLVDMTSRRIIIDDIAHHDAAYNRINKL